MTTLTIPDRIAERRALDIVGLAATGGSTPVVPVEEPARVDDPPDEPPIGDRPDRDDDPDAPVGPEPAADVAAIP